MAAEDGDKTCRYQVKDGEVINQLFPMGNKDWKIPNGWYDSPKAAKAAAEKKALEPVEEKIDLQTAQALQEDINSDEFLTESLKSGSLEGLSDDDSAGHNQPVS